MRKTKQRGVIRGLVLRTDRPLDKDEILRQAKLQVPTIGDSTVYRILREMQEDGTALVLTGPGNRLYYESASWPRHHHGFCRTCWRAFCVHVFIDVRAMVPPDFVLEGQELQLYGCCQECR